MASDRMQVSQIQTPALLLSLPTLEKNCARMRAKLAAHGVALRPHLKTAKCLEVAQIAHDTREPRPVTVATLAEAEFFLKAGYNDVLYAVGITPTKLARVRELCREGAASKPAMTVLLDSVLMAEAVCQLSVSAQCAFRVAIEIDCGQGRGGILPTSPSLLAIAGVLAKGPLVELRGVMTHGGQSYDCRRVSEMREVAEKERSSAVLAASRLREAGFSAPMVSVGSTPTALFAESFEGVTEVRAGVYVFFDLFQHAIGCCEKDDLALSVLASVIGEREDEDAVWIDAGTLGLSSERSLDQVLGTDAGYGEVADVSGAPLAGKPRVSALNQEHGKVTPTTGKLDSRLTVGSRVRVWPNHACITAAMHDGYYVLDADGLVVAEWPRL